MARRRNVPEKSCVCGSDLCRLCVCRILVRGVRPLNSSRGGKLLTTKAPASLRAPAAAIRLDHPAHVSRWSYMASAAASQRDIVMVDKVSGQQEPRREERCRHHGQ
jgi:hypothetical protein